MAATSDRTERAFLAHRDALQEIDRGGDERTMIIEALITINEWGTPQRDQLISEILYACDAAELDDATRRSLETTLEYLSEV
jgi:hypothetical protein